MLIPESISNSNGSRSTPCINLSMVWHRLLLLISHRLPRFLEHSSIQPLYPRVHTVALMRSAFAGAAPAVGVHGDFAVARLQDCNRRLHVSFGKAFLENDEAAHHAPVT